jgi:hypothetical protein
MFYPSVVGTSSRASSAAQQAQGDAWEARNEVDYIKHDIERLLMITEALWMMLTAISLIGTRRLPRAV